MNKRRLTVAFMVGVLFALGLGISGMTQPQKVIGFLSPWNWDPSLLFVMMGAVGVHAVFYPIVKRRKSPLLDVKWHLPKRRDVDFNLVVGAAIFGVGWGLGGFCPGPALTSLASFQVRAAVFVAAMIAGIWLHTVVARKPRG